MTQIQFDKIVSSQTEVGEQINRFLLKDLARGKALTIGNTLRRILLSDLQGTAITAVRINGVKSEFSTLPGVREDILELLLNLKQIRFSGMIETPYLIVVDVQGPTVITSRNIHLPSYLTQVNSNQYIATVSEAINVRLELKIESGQGYQLNETGVTNVDVESGFLPIDAIFTPVRAVNFNIKDSYKIGEISTEILELEITTDGSVSPREILQQAIKNIQTLFGSLLVNESRPDPEPEEQQPQEILIEELDLSVRSYNCLKSANIITISELVKFSLNDLKRIKNFGKKSSAEVVEKLQKKFGVDLIKK